MMVSIEDAKKTKAERRREKVAKRKAEIAALEEGNPQELSYASLESLHVNDLSTICTLEYGFQI